MTKKERLAIYERMLNAYLDIGIYTIEDYYMMKMIPGLCIVLVQIGADTTLISHYKELMKHKPRSVSEYNYWFPRNREGYDKRICVLMEAIMDTL